jgi:zinc transport system ATP-binding protein
MDASGWCEPSADDRAAVARRWNASASPIWPSIHRAPVGRTAAAGVLARALANDPDLLLDGLTGVDAAATSLYELLRSLHEDGITILVVSHDVGVVATYVDGVACVNRRLVAHGRPDEVLGSEELAQMYGCEAMFFHHGRVPHLVVEKEQ